MSTYALISKTYRRIQIVALVAAVLGVVLFFTVSNPYLLVIPACGIVGSVFLFLAEPRLVITKRGELVLSYPTFNDMAGPARMTIPSSSIGDVTVVRDTALLHKRVSSRKEETLLKTYLLMDEKNAVAIPIISRKNVHSENVDVIPPVIYASVENVDKFLGEIRSLKRSKPISTD